MSNLETSNQRDATQPNPDMVVSARELRGISQARLAKKTGIGQGTLSKYEHGLLGIPDTAVQSFAEVLVLPCSFFFQRDQRRGTTSPCAFFRKKRSLAAKTQSHLQARLNLARIHCQRLVQSVEIDTTLGLPHFDSESNEGPARVAELVRATWALPDGPIQSVTAALENAGVMVCSFDFDTDAVDAISQHIPGYPPVMLLNARITGDRQRFTLCHELGHLVMHKDGGADIEREADRFASALLLPDASARAELKNFRIENALAVKEKWGMSIQALARRALDVGNLTDRQYRSFMVRISKEGWRKQEPFDVPRESPSLLPNILRVHRDDLDYSLTDLSNLLSLFPDELLSWYNAQPTMQQC